MTIRYDFSELNHEQRHKLGLLKAIELCNVCIKTRLTEVEPELANNISKLVRQTMRERHIKLSGLDISLKDEKLKEIIDLGAKRFALGKTDKEIWLEACSLSNQMCEELHIEIYTGLKRLIKLVPGFSIELEWAVAENFLERQSCSKSSWTMNKRRRY